MNKTFQIKIMGSKTDVTNFTILTEDIIGTQRITRMSGVMPNKEFGYHRFIEVESWEKRTITKDKNGNKILTALKLIRQLNPFKPAKNESNIVLQAH